MKKLSKFLSILAVSLTVLIFNNAAAAAQGAYISGTSGIDVSYPNCSTSLSYGYSFGVVGVTGGLGFSPNNCLAKEAAHFKNLSLYLNTGYPGQSYGLKYQNFPNACSSTDLNCLAYNYGYNAGEYAINYASSQNVSSATWWLDVETMNTWTSDSVQNIQSLQGETSALLAAGVTTVGIYSTTVQWKSITNGWQNGFPNWGATTWNTAKQAASYCTGHQFTGGPTYLIQYHPRGLDQDYAC